jgi:adenylyl-sulfate kinase
MSNQASWRSSSVTPIERTRLLRQSPMTVWLTGLSGSGKSTLAFELELRMHRLGHACYVLDGDIVRHGLNRDLGFTPADRTENIRRIAEVARLFNDAGLIVITAFIAPYTKDREAARDIIGAERFLETYLTADLATCERRDPKGLYAKARAGQIADFTGISAPYEVPTNPVAALDTGSRSIDACTEDLLALLSSRVSERKS